MVCWFNRQEQIFPAQLSKSMRYPKQLLTTYYKEVAASVLEKEALSVFICTLHEETSGGK